MHTTEGLDGTSFEYRVEGNPVPRETVMPPIASNDRVGIVMRTGAEGLGAGSFLLSCVTAFYDYLGETREGDFFEYPDYYTFQTTEDPADYRMLDIYPDHKNLTVEPDAEHLLQAINDRAVTILLVPDAPPTSPDVNDIALQSARRRMDSCYVYAPDGRPSDAAFSIRQPRRPANEWFEATIESMDHLEEVPAFGSDDDSIHQQFSPVPLERALERLPG